LEKIIYEKEPRKIPGIASNILIFKEGFSMKSAPFDQILSSIRRATSAIKVNPPTSPRMIESSSLIVNENLSARHYEITIEEGYCLLLIPTREQIYGIGFQKAASHTTININFSLYFSLDLGEPPIGSFW
jgi:hypothetical protein